MGYFDNNDIVRPTHDMNHDGHLNCVEDLCAGVRWSEIEEAANLDAARSKTHTTHTVGWGRRNRKNRIQRRPIVDRMKRLAIILASTLMDTSDPLWTRTKRLLIILLTITGWLLLVSFFFQVIVAIAV